MTSPFTAPTRGKSPKSRLQDDTQKKLPHCTDCGHPLYVARRSRMCRQCERDLHSK